MDTPANPYPGPRAFGEEDRERFFGRDREIRQLRALAVSRRAVLLYAPSGAGKTSLLQAGLLPALRAIPGAGCLPVARVSGDPPARQAVANLYVFNLLTFLLGDRSEPRELARLSLREGLERVVAAAREAAGPDPAPGVLFLTIDQGEEIFSLAPHRFAEREAFFQQLREALAALPEVTLIFALREDWLASLDPYLSLLPDRLRTRFRLELLGREEALRAVTEPARRGGVTFLPEAAGQLVDDLRRLRVQGMNGRREEVPGPYVDPVQLQVVCRKLWERRSPGSAEIGPADIDALKSVDQALADYWAEEAAEAAACAGIPERAVRRWIGRQLITSGKLRNQVLRETGSTQGLDDRAVRSLIAAHLVRAERRRGAVWLELAHDRLIEPVLQDNEAWEEAHLSTLERAADAWERAGRPAGGILTGDLLAEAERWAKEHTAEVSPAAVDFLAASRRERSHGRARRLVWMTSALLAVAVLLTLFAVREQRAARRQALVHGLVAQARLFQRENLDLALLLAVEASRRSFPATRSLASQALFDALTASPALDTLLHHPRGQVLGLAFHPGGRLLATSLDDGTLQIWDVHSRSAAGPPLRVSGGRAWSVAWSPDGQILAAAGERALVLWDRTAPSSPPRRLPIDADLDAYAVAFRPDGRTLAAATSAHDVRRWDMETGASLDPPLRGPSDWVPSLSWSPDGKHLAAASLDKKLYLWDARTGRLLWGAERTRHPEGIYGTAFHPGGHLVVSAGHDGSAALWETATGNLRGWPLHLVDGLARSVAISPDGRHLAVGSHRGAVALWDLSVMRPASAGLSGQSGDVLGLAFAPDGRTLASSHGSSIALWRLDPALPLGRLVRPSEQARAGGAPAERITRTRSPDGLRVATTDRDHRIFLWTADTGELLAGPFTGHTEEIVRLAFSSDGRTLDSLDREGTRIRWDVDPASWRDRACRLAGRRLTAEEWSTFLPGLPDAPSCSGG